jgi:hypothetical protein
MTQEFEVIISKKTKYEKFFTKIQTKVDDALLGESQVTYYFFGKEFKVGSKLDVNIDDYKVVVVPFTTEEGDEIPLKYLKK